MRRYKVRPCPVSYGVVAATVPSRFRGLFSDPLSPPQQRAPLTGAEIRPANLLGLDARTEGIGDRRLGCRRSPCSERKWQQIRRGPPTPNAASGRAAHTRAPKWPRLPARHHG